MKKMVIIVTCVASIIWNGFGVFAQTNVGIGTTTPNPSARLDIVSSNQGVLVPRMNTAGMLAIPSPANSLLIYNTDSSCFFYWNSVSWKSLCNNSVVGIPGATGATGSAGVNGINCWDLNNNGVNDVAEDINGDGNYDALDCAGPTGPSGGQPGPTGPTGPPATTVLYSDLNSAANVANSSEQVLKSWTMPSNSLTANGSWLEIEVYYKHFGPGTNDLRLRINGDSVATFQWAWGGSGGNSLYQTMMVKYYRVNNTSQKSFHYVPGTSNSWSLWRQLSHNLSNNIIIEATGQNSAAAANTIIIEAFTIRKIE